MTFKRLVTALLAALAAASCQPAYANTTTTNLGLNKPGVGADADLWGAYLNNNEDTLEALFGAGPVLLLTKGGTGASTAAGARTNLGLPLGTSGAALCLLNSGCTWSSTQSFSSGSLLLTNGTSNLLSWGAAGVAAPAFTTSSAGEKALLFSTIDGTHVNYALGVESNFLWLSVPQAVSNEGFKFYGGTTLAASISGTGDLVTKGDNTLGDANADTTTVNGHAGVVGTSVTIGTGVTCGTSPTTPPGGSNNDQRGSVRNGSGTVTSCKIFFSRAWLVQPVCVVSLVGSTSATIGVDTISTADLTVRFSASYNGDWNYVCVG